MSLKWIDQMNIYGHSYIWKTASILYLDFDLYAFPNFVNKLSIIQNAIHVYLLNHSLKQECQVVILIKILLLAKLLFWQLLSHITGKWQLICLFNSFLANNTEASKFHISGPLWGETTCVTCGFLPQRANNVESISISWYFGTLFQTVIELRIIIPVKSVSNNPV